MLAGYGFAAWEFIHTFGDLHIYNNHFEQVNLQLSRQPKELPTMKLNPEVKIYLILNTKILPWKIITDHGIKAPIAI